MAKNYQVSYFLNLKTKGMIKTLALAYCAMVRHCLAVDFASSATPALAPPALPNAALGLAAAQSPAAPPTPLSAAATLDTQQRLRSQEQERALREQLEPQPDVLPDKSREMQQDALLRQPPLPVNQQGPLPHDETPCFVINKIFLEGEAAEQFQWVLSYANPSDDPALGQCLGTQGINIVTARIQRAIIDRGFVTTRVLVPPQKIDSGILTLTVIPGRMHTIRFEEGTNERAKHWNAMPMQRGDLLNVRDIEQALENFQRLPTVTADIKMTPASEQRPDESDLVISWKQPRALRVSAFLDDSGSRSTGKYQSGLTLSLDHPFALNDLFYLTLNHDLGGGDAGDRGTRGNMLHYSVPYAKWLFSFTQSRFHYHQSLPGPFSTHIYHGESDNSEIKLSRLLYRSRALKTTAAMRLWVRQSRNFINSHENQDQQRRMAGWEASLGQRAFIQAATLDLNLAYRRGTGMLNTLSAPEEGYGEGTSRPQIIIADMTFSVPFKIQKQSLQYNLTARAQWNPTPLVPQDRFAIGSRYTVRGFDGEMQLIGEGGYFLRHELSLPVLNSGQSLYMGLDYGEVDGPATQHQLGKRLMGGVFGLRGGFKNLHYDLFIGQPLKHPKYFPASSTVAGFSASYQY